MYVIIWGYNIYSYDCILVLILFSLTVFFFYTLPKFKFEISKDSPEFKNENFHKDVN